ncbi:MAG: YedE family putative selenium transporter [Treponemataceae bacterium]
MKKHFMIILTGIIVGIVAVMLVKFGNPGNMGFCIACFLRDIAGALHLHSAGIVQYMRPEIMGLVLGAFIAALLSKEFKPVGGSATFSRFILGFFVTIGALMFLGCPLRMFLRLGAGDLNAISGLVGFVIGVLAGVLALNQGFSFERNYEQSKTEGFLPVVVALAFLLLLVAFPGVLLFSEVGKGPGGARAPILFSLGAGLLVGALAQRSRLCTVGGIRDSFLLKDFHLLFGAIAILLTTFIFSLILGQFNPGFAGQPVAHNDWLWNGLGMVLVGFGSVLLGGCPLRQIILSAEGNSDSTMTVLGLTAGAAFAHNFGLASSPKGPTSAGMIAVVVGLVVAVVIASLNIYKNSRS